MIHASAPGRIGLLGGYSVLERGNASYSVSVDARVHATLREAKYLKIVLPQFNVDTLASWDGRAITLQKPNTAANFAIASLTACFELLKTNGTQVSNFELTTKTDDAFGLGAGKSGLGSSAAATVAMACGILSFHGIEDLTWAHHAAQVAHNKAQGKIGSGYDVAASAFGSQEYQRYSPSFVEDFPKTGSSVWDSFIRPLPLPSFFYLAFASFPKESSSTVSMVKMTNAWKEKQPEKYRERMKELNEANVNAIAYLEEIKDADDMENLMAFKESFEKGRAITRELGEESGAPIEPQELQSLIDQSQKNGAFVCKSPGAGGKDALFALCLSEKDAKRLKAFFELKGLEPWDIKVDNRGVLVGSS